MKSKTVIFALLLSAVQFAAKPAFSADYELMLGYSPLAGTDYETVSKEISNRISEATDGRVDIKTNGSLFNGAQLAPAVRDARIDMALVVPAYYAATEPVLGVVAMPGLIMSLQEYKTVMDGAVGDQIRQMWSQKYNSAVLMDTPFCRQELLTTREFKTIDDFRGAKIRVNNPQTGQLVQKLGGESIATPAAEILPALQQGVIDGVVTAGCWARNAGVSSVVRYASQWRIASYLPWELLVNEKAWEKLPADLQEAVKSELAAWQGEFYAKYDDVGDRIKDAWAAQEVDYLEVPQDEVNKVMAPENVEQLYQRWYEQAEKAGVDGHALVEMGRKSLGKN